ncbi:MAG: TMEM175 family protein [Chitinophagales bacterium]|nr:TMEM175 family protein [Chitinophagales bacterium]
MGKSRIEAFSDGVIAIIITIMVLEMKVPHGDEWQNLAPLFPVFISYLLSFLNVAIYWNNHHHLFHAARNVNSKVLWANIHLLFWLSLFPFVTGWMGENHFTTLPIILYGVILLMAGVAYYILSQALIQLHGKESTLAIAVGKDKKGLISVVIYLLAIFLSLINGYIGLVLYAIVAAMWLIPDQRIEKKIIQQKG